MRRIHNFALDMNWLPVPVIPKRQWPEVRHQQKRAIMLDEHQAIVARETNPERFAQEALGHQSRAVHRAYAKRAKVIVPSLEQYEKLEVCSDGGVI